MTTLSRIRQLWPQTPTKGNVIEIPNVSRNDLARLFTELNYTTGVEIGTERGLYAEVLCSANPRLHLYCVDPYIAYRGYREHTSQVKLDEFRTEAMERLEDYRVTFMRLPSVATSSHFDDESLDFIFIDGNHELLHVVQDLCKWAPKVKRGGCIAGHDWIQRKDPAYNMHVPQAVTAYVNSYHIKPLYILGRKAIIDGEARDTPRSWFFIRE